MDVQDFCRVETKHDVNIPNRLTENIPSTSTSKYDASLISTKINVRSSFEDS